ncbi:unnamed protein product [Closterium sp. Naga37s-1]|nr:unnamed protein product [Closterium sp. Naga37s-1]
MLNAPCSMPMLMPHAHAPCSLPHAPCSCPMLMPHAHAPCSCPMPSPSAPMLMPHGIHAPCSCPMPHAPPMLMPSCPCSCPMLMPHAHAPCFMPNAHAPCSCPMLHAPCSCPMLHAPCSCPMLMPHAHSPPMLMPHAHAPFSCPMLMPHAHAPCSCPMLMPHAPCPMLNAPCSCPMAPAHSPMLSHARPCSCPHAHGPIAHAPCSCPCSCPMLMPHAHAPCSCPMLMPHAHAPCSCPMLMPHAHAPCSCPMLMPHAHAPCSCPMLMPHAHAPCSCPMLMPHAHAPCSCPMLMPHAHAPCSCPMLMPHAHAPCSCPMLMPHAHAPCSCPMLMPHAHAPCSCPMLMPHAHAPCSCPMLMPHAHAPCSCPMLMPHAHAPCSCPMLMPHAHAPCSCPMLMPHAHAPCSCPMLMPHFPWPCPMLRATCPIPYAYPQADVGFSGFRFDYGKGYSAEYVRGYVQGARLRLCVGEYWDTCNYVGAQYDLDYDQGCGHVCVWARLRLCVGEYWDTCNYIGAQYDLDYDQGCGHVCVGARLRLCVGEYWDTCNYIGAQYDLDYDQGGVRLCVGEYWDTCNYVGAQYDLDYDQGGWEGEGPDSHRGRIVEWVEGAGRLAAVFDFTTKAILQEAVKRKEWWRLKDKEGRPPGVMGLLPSHAVTFVDNHDTGSTQAHWPFPSHAVIQGYAYILTHPGIPSVFYDHFFDWGTDLKNQIQQLIDARRRAGIHSRSLIQILAADDSRYAAIVGGNLCVKIGDGEWSPELHLGVNSVEVSEPVASEDGALSPPSLHTLLPSLPPPNPHQSSIWAWSSVKCLIPHSERSPPPLPFPTQPSSELHLGVNSVDVSEPVASGVGVLHLFASHARAFRPGPTSLFRSFPNSCAELHLGVNSVDVSEPVASGVDGGTTPVCIARTRLPARPRLRGVSRGFHVLRVTATIPAVGMPRGAFSPPAPKFEFCVHWNASQPLGECPRGAWRAADRKGRWVVLRSPFEGAFIDVKREGGVVGDHDVSIKVDEDLEPHRVVFFVLGFLLMLLAGHLSSMVAFYYGGGMTLGVLLVVIVILYQVSMVALYYGGGMTLGVLLVVIVILYQLHGSVLLRRGHDAGCAAGGHRYPLPGVCVVYLWRISMVAFYYGGGMTLGVLLVVIVILYQVSMVAFYYGGGMTLGVLLVVIVILYQVSMVAFYYGGGMTLGVLLVVIVILYQVMRLLPLGRKSSLQILLYGSLMGFIGVIITYVSGAVKTVMEPLGLGDDVISPVVVFVLVLVVLIGAALGFWVVRKFILSPTGELDPPTVSFVKWGLRIIAATLLIMSSADAIIATSLLLLSLTTTLLLHLLSPRALALLSPSATPSATPTTSFLARACVRKGEQAAEQEGEVGGMGGIGGAFSPPQQYGTPPQGPMGGVGGGQGYMTPTRGVEASPYMRMGTPFQGPPGTAFETSQNWEVRRALLSPPPHSLVPSAPPPTTARHTAATSPRHRQQQSHTSTPRTPSSPLSRSVCPSSFHRTPHRRHLTPAQAAAISHQCTHAALQDLAYSPGFGQWVLHNFDRIAITPRILREERSEGEIAATAEMEEGFEEEG